MTMKNEVLWTCQRSLMLIGLCWSLGREVDMLIMSVSVCVVVSCRLCCAKYTSTQRDFVLLHGILAMWITSLVYLLDWHAWWQVWPLPSVVVFALVLAVHAVQHSLSTVGTADNGLKDSADNK